MISLFEFFLKMNKVEEQISGIKIDVNDFGSLPGIEIRNQNSFDILPTKISCVYFLTHPSRGVLYVGKAADLRVRWINKYPGQESSHDCYDACIKVGGMFLRWFTLQDPAKTIAEMLLIRKLRPEWNSQFMGARPIEEEMNDEYLKIFESWMREKPRSERQIKKYYDELLKQQTSYKKSGPSGEFDSRDLVKDMRLLGWAEDNPSQDSIESI